MIYIRIGSNFFHGQRGLGRHEVRPLELKDEAYYYSTLGFELAVLEGREYRGVEKGKKRTQSWVGEEVGDYSPPVRRAQLSSPVGDGENPIALRPSKTPSPVKFQKPGAVSTYGSA